MSKGKDKNTKTNTTSTTRTPVPVGNKVTERVAVAPRKTETEIKSKVEVTRIKTSKERAAEVLAKAKRAPISSAKVQKEIKPPPPKSHQQPVAVHANNVMYTVHNVTVSSPTLKRKENPNDSGPHSQDPLTPPEVSSPKQRVRTKTRTIDPSQSVMQKILQQKNIAPETVAVAPPPPPPKEPTPSPIAFEISLESYTVPSENEYEDDFESYESDFESETSKEGSEEEEEEDSSDPPEPQEASGAFIQQGMQTNHRDEERKLDSGNYDLPVSKDRSILDGIRESTERIDHEPAGKKTIPVKKLKLSERQLNRMKTLSLDTITYQIFEQKPMDYERYMRIYGHLSSSQVAVQTKFDDVCHEEMQTDGIEMCNRWTQNPPKYGSKTVIEKKSTKYQEEGVGAGVEDSSKDAKGRLDTFSNTLVDYERLNRFLICSCNTIAQILDGNKSDKEQAVRRSPLPQFNEFLEVQPSTMQSAKEGHRVKYVHTFGHVIVVLLEGIDKKCPEVLEIYTASYLKAPQSILVSRNKIRSVVIHSKHPSYLFGATTDGCICVWDYTACSSHQADDNSSVLRRRPAIASFVPEFLAKYAEYCTLTKLVELSSDTDYSISGEDLAALYSPGIFVIWSIQGKRILKEVKTIELFNKCVIPKGIKSKFEKNVTYFESNIFSDAALQELQNVKSAVDQAQNLIFIDLLFDGELLISISNQNFVAVTTVGLKNKTKKIIITGPNEGHTVKITSAAVFKQGMLLIGLSDGTLKLHQIVPQSVKKNAGHWEEEFTDENSKDQQQLVLDKSCAIQNIVLNERKFYATVQEKDHWDGLDSKEGQSSSSLSNEKQTEDMEVTQKIIVHGSYFQRSHPKDLNIQEASAAGSGFIYFVDQRTVKALDMETGKLSSVNGKDGAAIGISLSRDEKLQSHFMVRNYYSIEIPLTNKSSIPYIADHLR